MYKDTVRQELINACFALARASATQEAKREHLTQAMRLMNDASTVCIETTNAGLMARALRMKNVMVLVCAWCFKPMGLQFGGNAHDFHSVCKTCKERSY